MALSRTLRSGTFTPADGSLLVVVRMHMRDADTTPWDVPGEAGMSGGGLTWTPQLRINGAQPGGAYNQGFSIWTAPVTIGASMSVTPTDPTNTMAAWQQIIEYTGQDASPIGLVTSGHTNNTDGSFNPSLGASPASASEVIAGISTTINGGGNVYPINGTGWTDLLAANSGGIYGGDLQVRGGSTDSTALWDDLKGPSSTDVTHDGYTWVAIEIKAAAGASGNPWNYYTQQ